MKKILFFALAASCTMAVNAQTSTEFPELASFKGDFAAGDIDDNGTMDFIYSGSKGNEVGAIMLNDGTGVFTVQEGDRVIKIGQAGNIKFGDIDGDGDLDVIFTGWGEGSNVANRGIALNDGNGVFTLQSRDKYPVQNYARVSSCGFADFNLDGLLDYYFFGQFQNIDGKIISNSYVYLQQQDGTFTSIEFPYADLKLVEPEVTLVDFDNDGDMDMFITAHTEATNRRFSRLFRNDGAGNFTLDESVEVFRPKANGSSFWQDVNGDGYMDLLLAGNAGNAEESTGETSDFITRIYKNVEGKALEVAQDFSDRSMPRQSSVGNGLYIVDWNNDGKLDVLVGGWSAGRNRQVTEIHLGLDPEAFTFATYMDVGTGVSEEGYRIADLDGDNKVDLLYNGWSSNGHQEAGWTKNNTENASVLPEAPAGLKHVVADNKVTFSWEAPASEAGKYGTTYNLSLYNKTTQKWMYNPMANLETGWRKVGGRMGNVCLNKEYTLTLSDGEYEWTVQAINGAYLGGAFAGVQTFTVGEGQGTFVENATVQSNVLVRDSRLIVKGADAQEMTLVVFAMNGTKVYEQVFAGAMETTLAQGAYLVEVRSADKAPYRTKVIMQ